MNLDEAIKHAEEVAEEQEGRGYCDRSVCVIMDGCEECEVVKCRECAKEHYQLAEWLKELKAHREAWDGMKEGLLEMSRRSEYVSIKHMIQLIDKIRPKEG